MWATDEHRIGLQPILRKVWALPGQRRIIPVQTRYQWRSLVGFVHPQSGRTFWQTASTVNIDVFGIELAAFAEQAGAGPDRELVLVLDRAGWHTSARLKVPDHVHLTFLPPYSPKCNRRNTCGGSPTRHSSTAISVTCRSWMTCKCCAVRCCKGAVISSRRAPASTGGPWLSSHHNTLCGISITPELTLDKVMDGKRA